MNFDTGGRGAIERMVEAYGFTTRQALSNRLGISKSTLANRYMRDSFPAEWVIQCCLETGVSLSWLVTGQGHMFDSRRTDIIELDKKKIIENTLYDCGFCIFDKVLLPSNVNKPVVINDNEINYICEFSFSNINDGFWLIDIDGNVSIKEIVNIPDDKIKIITNRNNFDCNK
ncbi:TPA: phage repressor protein CI, partial [Salmonella enterica subsp. enterica serovar Paratyphi C]|nr:phage repressor protein CI [Salmonella enterica subsp. enterica serovar Paratyphi C]